jgi:Na+(H+)/acetate symporter ActP
VAFLASLFVLLASFEIATALLEALTGLSAKHACLIAAILVGLPAVAGGMRSLAWTEAVQYFVIVLACLVPAGYLTFAGGLENAEAHGLLLIGNLAASAERAAREAALGFAFMSLAGLSLPALVARALVAPSAGKAAGSMFWATLFSVAAAAAGLVFWHVLTASTGTELGAGAGRDLLQLAEPFAALPDVAAGLIAAGALLALFAVGQASLFSAATALGHDAIGVFDPGGPETLRIVLARMVMITVTAAAAVAVSGVTLEAAALLQWGLAFAASGLLVPLLLGLRWKGCSETGALSAILSGFGVALSFFLASRGALGNAAQALAASGPAGAALTGVTAAFLAAIGVSLFLQKRQTPAVATAATDNIPDSSSLPGQPA